MGTKREKSTSTAAGQSSTYGLRSVFAFSLRALTVAGFLASSSPSAAFDLRYGGRLTDPRGAPLNGLVDITFRFYRDATGGTALVTVPAPGVALVDGIFNAPVPLAPDEVDRLFEDGDRPVYIEVESQSKIYPRQLFSYVPLALRVPVDGSKIVYNASGQLTLGPGAPTGFSNLPGVSGSGGVESLGNQTYATYTLSAAGKSLVGALTTAAQRNLLGLGSLATRNSIAFSDLPVAPCAEGNVLRLTGGTWACVALDLDGKLGGKTLDIASPGAESTGKVVKWNGTKFTLGTDELGAPDGGITSLNSLTSPSQTLGVEVPGVSSGTMPSWSSDAVTSTHKLTIPMASNAGISAGLLSKSQYDVFSAKQEAISPASMIDAGTVTTHLQKGLALKAYSSESGNTGELRFGELAASGNQYVGFKAPDSVNSNTIWTLPPSDGTGGYVLSTNGSGALSWISPTTGSITSIVTGTGLTGGPINGVGTIALADVGTASTYTKVTTNAQGQVISGAALAESDIPSLSTAKITSGSLPVALGGTGATSFTNNGVLVGSGTAPLSATVAGSPYQALRAEAGGAPAFGAISLDQSAAVTGVLPLANGGTGAATAAAARTSLGLGSAATLDAGTAADNVVKLDSTAKLPAVDGTQLTGVVKSAGDTMTGALSLPANGLAVGTNQLVVTGGNVGIGTTAPSSALEIFSTTSTDIRGIRNGQYSDSPDGAQLNLLKARGSIDAPTVVLQNDVIGNVSYRGHNGTQFDLAARIRALASENWSTTSSGTDLVFETTSAGTRGPAERMRIAETGNVGIGTTSPASKLHINSGDIIISDADFHRGLLVKNTISSTPLYPYLSVQNFKSSTGGSPVIHLINSRGSEAAPAALQAQDDLGMVIFSGRNESTNPQAAIIRAFADGDFAGNAIPTSLSFSTGGTSGMVERLRVTSAGNVGIGTATPGATLDVNGTVRATGFTSTGDSAYSFSGQGVSIGTSTPGTDIFFGSGAARAIGIQSQAAAGNSLTVQAGGTTGPNLNGGDLILASGTANGSGASKIELKTASGGAPATAVTILGNGNVGIGVATPKGKLDLAGGALLVNGSLSNTSLRPAVTASRIAGEIAGYSGVGTLADDGFLRLSAGGGTNVSSKSFIDLSGWSTIPDMSGNITFGTAGAEKMRITANGNVGIGTTAPAAALQVKGQIATVLPNEMAPTGSSQTIDFALGNMQMVNLANASGNITLTLSNPVAGGSYAIKFTQGSTARAVIWPANVKWAEGNVMALSTAAGAIDLVTLFYDGTSYLAVGGRNFY